MSHLLDVSQAWIDGQRGASVGILAIEGVANPSHHAGLSRRADEIESELRSRFAGLSREQFRAVDPLPAYAGYYKRFGQRYHVAMQLESIVFKEKRIPRVASLVEAMFMAELRSLILTAGHDLGQLTLPIRLDVGTGAERYPMPGGGDTAVKPGDQYTADDAGVLSAVITGPADRARITSETTAVVFVCYAPAGVAPESVAAHLDEIRENVQIVIPDAVTRHRTVVTSGDGGLRHDPSISP
jgi:DNA/RNA-binding domain of Phe-tRNA-synthetase-like protein